MPLVPFTAHIPDSAITDLRERLARTRWPEAETVDDWSQGVPLNYLKDVCDYWADDYDWRSFETKLNSFEQGITTIEGLDIHYVHAPSPEPNAKPLIIIHGWPGSLVEHLDIIEPLRNPVAHGGSAEDAYHVVVPSAYSCFPEDLFTMTERWARTRYTDLRYYSQPARGGHFPSLEQPEAFVTEVRNGLRALR